MSESGPQAVQLVYQFCFYKCVCFFNSGRVFGFDDLKFDDSIVSPLSEAETTFKGTESKQTSSFCLEYM